MAPQPEAPRANDDAPLTPMLPSVIAALPVFDSVTVCVAGVLLMVTLPNDSAAGLRAATGAGRAVPVPVSVSVWLPLAALEASVSAAAWLPSRTGVKPRLSVQLAPAASGLAVLQLPARLKLAASAPDRPSALKTSAAWPLLLTVTEREAVALPTTTLPKSTALADSASVATSTEVPVPLSATVVLPLPAL